MALFSVASTVSAALAAALSVVSAMKRGTHVAMIPVTVG